MRTAMLEKFSDVGELSEVYPDEELSHVAAARSYIFQGALGACIVSGPQHGSADVRAPLGSATAPLICVNAKAGRGCSEWACFDNIF